MKEGEGGEEEELKMEEKTRNREERGREEEENDDNDEEEEEVDPIRQETSEVEEEVKRRWNRPSHMIIFPCQLSRIPQIFGRA